MSDHYEAGIVQGQARPQLQFVRPEDPNRTPVCGKDARRIIQERAPGLWKTFCPRVYRGAEAWGDYRLQFYGPDRSEHRHIWIEPILVNAKMGGAST